MKQMLYKWGLLSLVLLTTLSLASQTSKTCKRDFIIKTKVTESTCMANGVIEVTLEGDLTDLELEMTEFALRPIEGTTGTNLQFSRNNVLKAVTAGKYVVSVRTFCIEDTSVGVVTETTNIVVGGSYMPLMAELDLSRTRNSYSDCATGLIAFNMKNNTGYGDITYHLSKAPIGVTLGEVFPVKGSIVGGYTQYTLPGTYPSGDYQIDIYDSCSKATIPFTLNQTVGFPSITSGSFYPIGAGLSCNQVKISMTNPLDVGNNQYARYFDAKLYELALVPTGQTPIESDWQTWISGYVTFNNLPGFKDYFATGSLDMHIRVKGCSQLTTSVKRQLKAPTLYSPTTTYYCDYLTYSPTIYNTDYDGLWCYPLTFEAVNETTGVKIFEKTYTAEDVKNGGNLYPFRDVKLAYGSTYRIKVTDGSSYVHERTGINALNFAPSVSFYTYYDVFYCETFKSRIQVNTSYNCFPVELTVYKENNAKEMVVYDTKTLTSSDVTVEYPYGKFQLEITLPNHITVSGLPYTYKTSVIERNSPRPTTLTLSSANNSYSSTDLSNENYGYLQVYTNQALLAGSRITVVDAPEDYRHKGRTFTVSSTNSNYFYLGSSDASSSSSSIHMPTGNYTISVEDDCGTSLSATALLRTGYEADEVKYIVEEEECVGGRIKFDTQNGGYVKLKGVAGSSYTNFKIISGPSGGYETSLKRYNEELKIVADGEYIIGTVVNSTYPSYYIRRDTIQFEKSKPFLNPSVTSAYVCPEPGATYGYLIFTGQGGKANYHYELLNEDETPTGLTATGDANERVVFNYGLAGETYIVRITDDCGNSTTQQMTLANLKTQSIIYSTPADGEYCYGDEIKLNCITLGQTSYLWEKKISEGVYEFLSNAQNPRIASATPADNGTYRVTVTPEYCGEAITGELTVRVSPQLVTGTVSENQEICVATRANAMSCPVSGGRGNYSYQWQMSTDQTTWTNVVNGTTSTFAPLHARSGIYYYRLQVTDDCTTVSSDVITLNVKPCYIMVNPNIRSVAR